MNIKRNKLTDRHIQVLIFCDPRAKSAHFSGQTYTTTHTLALYKDHDHHHYRQTEKHKREQPTQGLVSITATPQKLGDGLEGEGGGGTL